MGAIMTMPAKLSSAAVTIALALLIGSASNTSYAQDGKTSDSVSLRGAGSTFAAPLYKKCIEEYAVSHPNVSISYDVVGSGEGVTRFLADAVDFAGSDEILTDSESAKAGGAIMIPVTAGMVVIAYNIPGVTSQIKLPRDVYVDIFTGAIRQWDDSRIKAVNPGITFPHRDIEIVAREDGSGTTAAFTHHLDAIGPTWRNKGMRVSKLIDWPKGSLLAPANEGVASKIQTNDGSIGYVEFWYAQRFGLRMATLQNKAGKFITPTADSGDLALSGRVALVKQLGVSVADPMTPGAYPIPSFSWMFLYPAYRDKAKAAALRDFAEWVLSQQAQDLGAQLGYLPLPADIIALGRRELGVLAK
jgi:phosphate transport system substrate-binding protein